MRSQTKGLLRYAAALAVSVNIKRNCSAVIYIKCNKIGIAAVSEDILYAEAFLHYIVIHTKDNEYKIKEPISVFENKVSDDFYRIHRSYLVSLKYITRISRASVTIGNATLPLSRGKYDDINRAFIEHN